MGDEDKTNDKIEFTNIDPETLSDELKGIYKSMQGDYTTKTQELSKMRKEFDGKEVKFEEQLKAYGAVENEVKQWRDWYKQLEEQTKDGKTGNGENDPDPGLDLTNADPSAANGDFNKLLHTLDQQIKGLQGELTSVHSSLKDSREQTNKMFSYQAQLSELAGKYPGLNKQEILDHALEIGQTDLEKAYKDLKQDDFIAAEVEKRVKAELDKERTSGVGTNSPGHQVIIRSNKDTPKTFAEASEQILAGMDGT